MKALLVERSVPRFAVARFASYASSEWGIRLGPLRLADIDPPVPPNEEWVEVYPVLAGICGSDLSMLEGRTSSYFEPLVSFPFIPGHEVVGWLDDGQRVVLEPVLSCAPRAISPPCPACERGDTGNCEYVSAGHLRPGLQTGYCADVGGGWSSSFIAHLSQLHRVPDSISDEEAVLIEPTASAVHAVLASGMNSASTVAVIGASTLGLCTVAALRYLGYENLLVVAAKWPVQQELALSLGADKAVKPSQLKRVLRFNTKSFMVGSHLSNGADLIFDCVGSADTISTSLEMIRPKGTVVMVGMPGVVGLDLSPLWHKEIRLQGAYTYGWEYFNESRVHSFELATNVVSTAKLGRLVSARYPLDRHEEALLHAMEAGKRDSIKVVFTPQPKAKRRTRSSAEPFKED